MIYRHCRSSQNLMTLHPLTKWKRPFSVSQTAKQLVLLSSLSMVGVLYTEGCIILSLTAGSLNVSHINGKMPTLFLCTSKWVTEQNVATVVTSPFSLWQAKCWLKSCLPIFSSTWLILSCLNLNVCSGVDAAQLT